MASSADDAARSPPQTTAVLLDETTAEPQSQHPSRMGTNDLDPKRLSRSDQAAEGSKSATKQTPGLARVDALGAMSPHAPNHQNAPYSSYVSSISSNGGVQLHTPTQANLRASATSIPGQSSNVDEGIRSPSSSFRHRSFSPALAGQVTSSSPLQRSLAPRYSSPNVSAVSSALASPVVTSSPKPRHMRSDSPENALSSPSPKYAEDTKHKDPCRDQERNPVSDTMEDSRADDADGYHHEKDCVMYNAISLGNWDLGKATDAPSLGKITSAHEYTTQREAVAAKHQQDDLCDGTNECLLIKDDAHDVMNPPFEGEGGLVIPCVEGIASIDSKKMYEIMGADLDTDSPDHGNDPPRFVRRASSPTGQPMSQFASPITARASRSAHVQFASNMSAQDTPFAKTLKYFKQFKDKENSPSKSRRNASLPDEIAELAKEAQQVGIDDEPELWDKYREIDLAPMDPVMDDGLAGDLITGTPTWKTNAAIAEDRKPLDRSRLLSTKLDARDFSRNGKDNEQTYTSLSLDDEVIQGHANKTGPMYQVDIPGHFDDAFQLRFRSRASVELIASFLRARGEALDANRDGIDLLLESFLEYSSEFIIRGPSDLDSFYGNSYSDTDFQDDEQVPGTGCTIGSDREDDHIYGDHTRENQAMLDYEDPTFGKIIIMLPEVMFWVVAHHCKRALTAADKVLDKLLQKIDSRALDEPRTSEQRDMRATQQNATP